MPELDWIIRNGIVRFRIRQQATGFGEGQTENGGDKMVHESGGIFPAAGGIKSCHL